MDQSIRHRQPSAFQRARRHRSGLRAAMAFAALLEIAASSPASAVPINYVLNPPVSGFGVTGGFTFDAAGPTLDAVNLSATGGPQPGTYTVPVSATPTEIVAEIVGTADRLLLLFVNPLGTAPDPVSGIAFPPVAPDPAPVTGAAAVPVIPEPASLALLGGNLWLLLLARARRRCRDPRSDKSASRRIESPLSSKLT